MASLQPAPASLRMALRKGLLYFLIAFGADFPAEPGQRGLRSGRPPLGHRSGRVHPLDPGAEARAHGERGEALGEIAIDGAR